MLNLSVRDILTEAGRHAAGTGIDAFCEARRDDALEIFNRATRLMMAEDRFPGTWGTFELPVLGNEVTLDRRILQLFSANLEKGSCADPVRIYGRMFQFHLGGFGDPDCGPGCLHSISKKGEMFALHREPTAAQRIMCFSDAEEEGSPELRIVGNDVNARQLRTEMDPGVLVSIKGQSGPAYTSEAVASIEALRKPRTKGYVYVYQYDPAGGDPYWLTTLAPDETSAARTRYWVPGGDKGGTLTVAATLRFVPLYSLEDTALIQNMDAYIYMFKSMAAEDTDPGRSAHMKNKAIRQLTLQTRQITEGETKQLNVNMIGGPGSVPNVHSRHTL